MKQLMQQIYALQSIDEEIKNTSKACNIFGCHSRNIFHVTIISHKIITYSRDCMKNLEASYEITD